MRNRYFIRHADEWDSRVPVVATESPNAPYINKKKNYGIPEQKKFPLDTRDHVMSAIRFFNYASPKYEKELASNITKMIKKYGIKNLTPSDKNRFYNYYKVDSDE